MTGAASLSNSSRSRESQLEALGNDVFDVLVLGGGISGISASHELTRRGYRVALIDDHDFASGTSQESSQLIWGGIKYLQQGHVKLVSGLCYDRNAFIRQYPDRVTPQRFVYPRFHHDPLNLVMLMAGTYAYWVIGRGFDARPHRLTTRDIERLIPRISTESFSGGVEYSEGRMLTSDARLTLDLLFDSMGAGLTAVNYVSLRDVNWRNDQSCFEVHAEDSVRKSPLAIRAKWIVNTTGIWADAVNKILGIDPPYRHLYSKGVHLVLPRIETSGRALTCLAKDGRIFFVIPWDKATLVGTTDTPFDAPPTRVHADREDIEYLRGECEAKFDLKIGDEDVLNTKAGLRPLVRPPNLRGEDFLSLARSHKVWSDERARITILWGGKYTNCFSMAEEIADQVGVPPSGKRRLVLGSQNGRVSDEIVWGSGADGDALAHACRSELVVKLEDLLRRRTNIGLKVARSGWGVGGENEPQLRKLALAISNAKSGDATPILEDYRRSMAGASGATASLPRR